jgi:hypothetical protein
MKAYRTRYQLHDGSRGVMTVLATSSCAAILAVHDTFGLQLRVCSARPV